MMEQTDLLVHCLCCDNTYRESEEKFIGWCPHCDNDDAHKTVYVEETNNEEQ
jgi:Zn finger protein HypA/HybF involved in hydrogenase expression